jgi:5-formyltetrahydrofolate cyclo-ligase
LYCAALPVVVEKQQPMEFWSWQPQMKLVRGIWNIPTPSERNPVQPTVLPVPLVGFDAAGYRMGQGGGYYDRTLATFAQKPLTIGIGHELGRLETIYAQRHDRSMDAIVTESGSYVVKSRSQTWIRELRSPQRDLNQLARSKSSRVCSRRCDHRLL